MGRTDRSPEKYHPFKDSTGFVYDIMLTRVDTLTNRNERINLTVSSKNGHLYSILVLTDNV